MTNSPGGNAIEAYARASDGSLTPAGTYPTGGALGSGHSIAVSGDGSVLVDVNAGSNPVSAFAATPLGLRLIGTVSSGGTDPNSVTIAGDHLVCLLNAGSETITGFWLGRGGLHPIPGSVRPLGAGAQVPRQIQFSADARVLVVDEEARTPEHQRHLRRRPRRHAGPGTHNTVGWRRPVRIRR